jgi:hypothetical protein
VRRYDAHVVAEMIVEGSHENAGNRAFRSLVGYIGGRNHTGRSVAMTAPVLQQAAAGRRMAMTAPVVQLEGGRPGSHIVGFVMPADETLETLPEPDDLGVTLRARGSPAQSFCGAENRGRRGSCRDQSDGWTTALLP